MKEYIEKKFPSVNHHLGYKPKAKTLDNYVPNPKSTTWTINSIITDNEASSVNQALKNLGCDVNINKQIHWEIEIDKNKKVSLQQIDKSGELYNSNKEFIDKIKIAINMLDHLKNKLKQIDTSDNCYISDSTLFEINKTTGKSLSKSAMGPCLISDDRAPSA